MSLELSGQARFLHLLKQPDEIVGVQLVGFTCTVWDTAYPIISFITALISKYF